jgi:hypothetical protein
MSSTTEVISHWNTLLEDFNTSPMEFYNLVTEAVEKRKIPSAKTGSVQWHESHLLSAKRQYLTISSSHDFYFAICAAPFGTGFFVSWWLLQPPDGCLIEMLRLIPFFGPLAEALGRPWTYYRIDTASMFQTATHTAVLDVIDAITAEKGLKGLPENERKPVMREFFRF